MSRTNERVPFRFLVMPCCSTELCWVNPRLPNYCPECGQYVYPKMRESILISDEQAVLSVDMGRDR